MDERSALSQPRLPLARYRLHYTAQAPLRLREHMGSAWRGAFGHALKRLVCVTRERCCSDCLLYRSCAYPYVFETPPDPSDVLLGKVNAAPHPFVLVPEPGRRGVLVETGAPLSLELILFGRGNQHLPYLIHAFDQVGRQGLGRERSPLALEALEQLTFDGMDRIVYRPGGQLTAQAPRIPEIPSCPPRLRVVLHTPLRLKRQDHHVTPETFDFAALFSQLLRRISLLTRFHTDTPLETDFKDLTRAARDLPLADKRLYWRDWTRYSARQRTTMQFGGLRGAFELDGENLAPFWPYLWLGQWTHAGKGTSMGLGKYSIEPVTSPC